MPDRVLITRDSTQIRIRLAAVSYTHLRAHETESRGLGDVYKRQYLFCTRKNELDNLIWKHVIESYSGEMDSTLVLYGKTNFKTLLLQNKITASP